MLCIPDYYTNSLNANQINYNNYYSYSKSWIGYSDSTNTGYKWVSGCSSSYTNRNYYSSYNYYDYAYMYGSSGSWYFTSDTAYSSIKCSCEYNSGSTSMQTSSTTTTSSVVATIIIVIAVVLFCCGLTIFGFYVYFVRSRNNTRVVVDDGRRIDASSIQEYGNGNISHTFPVTKINQENGNIPPSFPVASINQGFPVATSSTQGYGNIPQSYLVIIKNMDMEMSHPLIQSPVMVKNMDMEIFLPLFLPLNSMWIFLPLYL